MNNMFEFCSSLKSIDLSSFNTSNVIDISCMFADCSSLEFINLSSFNTINTTNMEGIFDGCSSLRKKNIKIRNKNDKILDEIND